MTVIGTALTALAWLTVTRQIRDSEQLRFQRLTERILADAQSRLSSAVQAVYGGRAWLAAGVHAPVPQWAAYAAAMEPYFQKGVVGIGYCDAAVCALTPAAVVDAIEFGLQNGFDKGSVRERELFADCVVSTESKALRHLFFAERRGSGAAKSGSDAGADAVRRRLHPRRSVLARAGQKLPRCS